MQATLIRSGSTAARAPARAAPRHSSRSRRVRTQAAPDAGAGPVVSPFSKPTVHRTVGEGKAKPAQAVTLSVESVDQALEEIREYLRSDGGEVDVVDVKDGTVFVRFVGACSTCSSQQTTMEMGIERQLRAVFGDSLRGIVQVDKQEAEKASVESVDLHLDMLRGAINGLGGRVEVASVEGDTCICRYKGPKTIGSGVQAAIKDKFPTITTVVLQDFPK